MDKLLQRFVLRQPIFSHKTSQVVICVQRSKHRAPPRVFGKTKAQLLDGIIGTNAVIWAAIGFLALPMTGYLLYIFQTKRKERTVETQALEQELLAEGKYQVAKQGIQ